MTVHEVTRSAATARTRPAARPARSSRPAADWTGALRRADVGQLWNELHRLVCYHPLVRASWNAGLLVETDGVSRGSAHTDLTQELFVVLLGKDRFQHYLDSEMTDQEIETEIGQIELTNLLTAELRKRHPESYRLARRISTVIQSSANFKRFDVRAAGDDAGDGEGEEAGRREIEHRRLADRVYGLSRWSLAKPRRSHHEAEQRAHALPVRQRDTRLVGCTGDAQVIISNSDLEDLIVQVLEAVDAPVDVRSLRSLVMSRLPVMDIYLVPLGGGDDSEDGKRPFEPIDAGETPEEGLLRRESEETASQTVDEFLDSLNSAVRGKAKQFDRMVQVLWHCYLSSDNMTQLETAARLGVSDSLVSDYRRRIETALRALDFSEVDEARRFERALRERVRPLAAVEIGEGVMV